MSIRRLLIAVITVCVAALAIAVLAWQMRDGAHPATESASVSCPIPPVLGESPHPGMVWVPAGRFDLGDSIYPEEQPIVKRQVRGFWMDRTEVTNAQFAAFVKATGYVTDAERPHSPNGQVDTSTVFAQPGSVVFVPPTNLRNLDDITQWWRYIPGANWRHPGGPQTSLVGKEQYPVVAVTYRDALAYAGWLGRQLPSEAQMEWATRAARAASTDGSEAPKAANTWQGFFPLKNTAEDGFVGLAPVGCYAPNALGLYDTLGNVWEITSDLWRNHHSANEPSPGSKPDGLPSSGAPQRVIKGGSYLCAANYCMRYRAAARQPQDEDLAASHLGFRTVLNAPGP